MPGRKELEKTLSAAIGEGLLSHAVLIEGEKGTGKRELAIWLAKALLCKSAKRPCGSCAVCRKIEDGNHPDVEIYDGSGFARSFHIESIREIKKLPLARAQRIGAKGLYFARDTEYDRRGAKRPSEIS